MMEEYLEKQESFLVAMFPNLYTCHVFKQTRN